MILCPKDRDSLSLRTFYSHLHIGTCRKTFLHSDVWMHFTDRKRFNARNKGQDHAQMPVGTAHSCGWREDATFYDYIIIDKYLYEKGEGILYLPFVVSRERYHPRVWKSVLVPGGRSSGVTSPWGLVPRHAVMWFYTLLVPPVPNLRCAASTETTVTEKYDGLEPCVKRARQLVVLTFSEVEVCYMGGGGGMDWIDLA